MASKFLDLPGLQEFHKKIKEAFDTTGITNEDIDSMVEANPLGAAVNAIPDETIDTLFA